MKFQVFASAVLSALLAFGVACSGDEEVKDPTDEGEGGGEEGEGGSESGGDAGEGEGEGEDGGDPADAPPEEPPPAEAAPAAEPPPPPPPAEPAAPAAAAAFQGNKVVRYVTAYALNVRSEPSKTAKVVRHVKHGDKVEVVINGEWAQIGPGEFLSVNRLSETPPQAKKWMKGGGGAKKGGGAAKKKQGK
jgi:hypothetical protein